MPPRAPAQELHEVVNDDEVSKAQAEERSKAPDTHRGVPKSSHTFHWELNLYSFSFLGLVYYLLPESKRAIAHVVFALIAVDAARYYYAKGKMAGVPYTLPFVSLLAMIVKPNRFWEEMASIAMLNDGICSNQLVGNFLVFATDPKKCRQILTGEGTYGVYAHPNALWLFGPKNLIYLDKERHKKFRGILTPAMFSKDSLTQFAEVQEEVVRKYMKKFANPNTVHNLLLTFRSMAAASSQESFMGPYLDDDQRVHLEEDILTFTMGFLCFPFPYLNSGLHKAIQAKKRIEKTIRDIVPKAREYIEAGNEPRCMMEHWSVSIINEAKAQGVDAQDLDCCRDEDMARTVLDFLFAAQDATNSALTYALDVLDANRDVLHKMREEVETACHGGPVWDKKEEMPYIAKVANQLLHHKPPVPMIPYISKKPSVLGGYPIPTRTITIPSITYSARANGTSLDFLPEREDDDHMFVKCLTFGGGQHKCPGRRYAESLLHVFLAVVAQDYDFERTGERPHTDDFIYFPTIFPKDSNFVIKPLSAKE